MSTTGGRCQDQSTATKDGPADSPFKYLSKCLSRWQFLQPLQCAAYSVVDSNLLKIIEILKTLLSCISGSH